jgi:hypothetical protein
MMVRILDRDRELVTQSLLGMSKTDAMLCLIATGFFGIKLDVHTQNIHMLYIFASASVGLHLLY